MHAKSAADRRNEDTSISANAKYEAPGKARGAFDCATILGGAMELGIIVVCDP